MKLTCGTTHSLPNVTGSSLVHWTKDVLHLGDHCLAFLCAATESSTTPLALQAMRALGPTVVVVSNDPELQAHGALPSTRFTEALAVLNSSPGPVAFLCHGINAAFKYASSSSPFPSSGLVRVVREAIFWYPKLGTV